MTTSNVHPDQKRRFHIPMWIGFCLFLAAVLFFLWEEHEAHILGALPYLILLACPLIHFFMHRGRGHDHHGGRSQQGEKR